MLKYWNIPLKEWPNDASLAWSYSNNTEKSLFYIKINYTNLEFDVTGIIYYLMGGRDWLLLELITT